MYFWLFKTLYSLVKLERQEYYHRFACSLYGLLGYWREKQVSLPGQRIDKPLNTMYIPMTLSSQRWQHRARSGGITRLMHALSDSFLFKVSL